MLGMAKEGVRYIASARGLFHQVDLLKVKRSSERRPSAAATPDTDPAPPYVPVKTVRACRLADTAGLLEFVDGVSFD